MYHYLELFRSHNVGNFRILGQSSLVIRTEDVLFRPCWMTARGERTGEAPSRTQIPAFPENTFCVCASHKDTRPT